MDSTAGEAQWRAGLARTVAPEGTVSILVRNGDALAMRPGLKGDWDTGHATSTPCSTARNGPARPTRT
jgi:uncharacterized cupin superfamily protein